MVTSLEGVDFKKYSEPENTIKRKFKNILQAENCSSQLIHDPIELPLSIEVFLSRLADAPKVGFILVSQFLDTRPQACLEAVIERCISILDNSMKGGRKKKISKRFKKI